MFCPGCGLSEDRAVQFCRSCGTDLGLVRDSLAQPEAVANSIASARQEIAYALASRIKTGEWWNMGAMISEAEKLFESPQQRRLRLIRTEENARLRRVRAGVITAASGLGLMLLFGLLSLSKPGLLLLAGPALVVFIIGLGIMLNGLFFTTKKKSNELLWGKQAETSPLPGDIFADEPNSSTSPSLNHASVTDQTTRHLSSELTRKAN